MFGNPLFHLIENDEENLPEYFEPPIQEIEQENPQQENEEEILLFPRRIFRDRLDLTRLPDRELIKKYRFPRHVIIELKNLVNDQLEKQTFRNQSIPVMTQVLACLRIEASGTFQNVIADTIGVSQSAVSNMFNNYLEAMVVHKRTFIKFPVHDANWVAATKQRFLQLSGFPGIIGTIDGTHFRVKRPRVDPRSYLNRRGQITVNNSVRFKFSIQS
jgi:hypothetical protein